MTTDPKQAWKLAREDAAFLRSLASTLSYSGKEAAVKHRLNEIASRVSAGTYQLKAKHDAD